MTLKLGPKAKEYYKVIEKHLEYRRSTVDCTLHNDAIKIEVEASDPVALVSSLNGVLKQLRVVGEVDNTMDHLLKK